MKFNFNDILMFDFSGKGKLFDYLIFQFDYFKANRDNEPSLLINFICGDKMIESKKIMKNFPDKKNIFSKTECGSFIWNIDEEFVIFEGAFHLNKQNNIYFSENFPKMLASMVVDFIFRVNLSSFGIVLLHAAALSNKDKGILIPSWKGMGKTALTLKLIQSGYDYMADDRVWLSHSGVIYSYPRYVVLKDSNYLYFPQFITFKMKVKTILLNITDFILFSKSKYSRFIKKIAHRFLKIKAQHHHVQNLLPYAKVIKHSQLENVLLLGRENIENVVVKEALSVDAVGHIDSINKYEWDAMLMSICAAHDALFYSDCCWQDEFLKLLGDDKKVLSEALSEISCYEGIIPKVPSGVSYDDLVVRIKNI